MDKPNKKLGRAIRTYRESLGLSLRDFAERAGVDYTMVLRLEHGRDVRASAYLKIAAFLNGNGMALPAVK
jgi:transcriptional regulator with XRE-family HTH domain